jgi:tripeptidyl-peptidase-1
MGAAQIAALMQPPAAHIEAVVEWLQTCAKDVEVQTGGDWVHASATVACAESLLGGDAKYYEFTEVATGNIVHRTQGTISLPAAIREYVDIVGPTNQFPAPIRPIRRGTNLPKLLGTNPTTIRTEYGMGSIQANNTFGNTVNTQQVAGFLQQYADPDGDLQSFFQEYYKTGTGRKFSIVGPNQALNAGDEASLDTQYIMAIGSNVTTTFWSTAGTRPYQNEPYLVWLTNLTALPDDQLPNTVSVSYGDNEYQIDPDYAARMDVEFQKLAVRGTSLIFASGDGGVAGGQSGSCLGPNGDIFVPTFPAGSPYITSVGATDGTYKKAASFSSGGFSNMYAAQSYQQAAIAHYKSNTTGLPSPTLYNATGRGFPDVSTVGEQFWIFCQGLDEPVDGTSCAAPTFTGIISLLNDARATLGKKPLGYLNQIFYAHPEIFTDITEGNNPGCGSKGFPAAPGWDPITGLGSPNFPAMMALAVQLP